MDNLKAATLIDENIVFVEDGKYFRYVNHDAKLATCGWGSKELLIHNKNDIRFDSRTLIIMAKRYSDMFNKLERKEFVIENSINKAYNLGIDRAISFCQSQHTIYSVINPNGTEATVIDSIIKTLHHFKKQ